MALVATQGKWVNAYDLASLYLRTAGLPDTARNRHILASWFKSESSHKGDMIHVNNNNPLFITSPSKSNPYFYIYKNGKPLLTSAGTPWRYRSYSDASTGATAWSNLLQSHGSYNAIYYALKHQDAVAFGSALNKSGWGTNASTWRSNYKATTDAGGTGSNVNNPIGNATLTSANADTYATDVGFLFDSDGKAVISFPLNATFDRNMADQIMGEYEKMVNADPNNYDPLSKALALDELRRILYKHADNKEKVTPELVAKIAVESNIAAFNAGRGNLNILPGPLGDIANTLNEAINPEKWVSRGVHLAACLAGGFLIWKGVRLMIDEATDKRDRQTVIVEGGRYPAFVEDSFEDVEETAPTIETPKAVPKPPPGRKSKNSNFKYDEYVDNSDQNPTSSSTFYGKKPA